MSSASLTIVHCAEDELAAFVSRTMLDCCIRKKAKAIWLREHLSGSLEMVRRYVDLHQREGWSGPTEVQNIRDSPKCRRLRIHPKGLQANAAVAYLCARLAQVLEIEGPWVLLLSFDVDRRPDQHRCRRGAPADLNCVVAEAVPEFDAWVLAGFVPGSKADGDRLESARSELRRKGFHVDPVTEPHRLTSNVDGDARDAKILCTRILGLEAQAGSGDGRVVQCLDSFEQVATNASQAGFAEFIADIERVVLPLLGDR